MTVRFLTSWNGYSAGDRATLSAANEAALISAGIARADYVQDGASPLYPPNRNDATAVVGAARFGGPMGFSIGIATFGDSETDNGYLVSGTDITERARGWSTWIGPMSMQRMRVVANFAQKTNGLLTAGTTPAGYPLSVQVTQALADPRWGSVNVAAIMIGTNDTTFTHDACVAELLTQIQRIGKPVVLIASPPMGTAAGPTTVVGGGLQKWVWNLQWRSILKRIADASPHRVKFVDGYSVLVDTSSPTNNYLSTRTYDDIHNNNAAAYLVADAFVSAIQPTLGNTANADLDIWTSNTSAATTGTGVLGMIDQGFANPILATATGGTGTGTIAGSLTVTNLGTATHSGSVIANPNGYGNMQRIAITSNAAGDGIQLATSSFHAAGGTFASAGDILWGEAIITVNSGGIYPKNLFFRLNAFSNPTNYNNLLWEAETSPAEVVLPFSGTRTFLLRTPAWVVPAGVSFSNMDIKFRPTFAGAGACTIDIGNIASRRIRAGGVYS